MYCISVFTGKRFLYQIGEHEVKGLRCSLDDIKTDLKLGLNYLLPCRIVHFFYLAYQYGLKPIQYMGGGGAIVWYTEKL